MTEIAPAYTQDDLDRDISRIDVGLEDVGHSIKRVMDNWALVQHLHPGMDAVAYIKQQVPFLAKNTGAAVALVGSGMTVSDAARLTGRAQSTVSEAVGKRSIGKPMDRPATIATGKAAPGPAIGTPRPSQPKKEKPPKNVTPRATPALVLTDEWDKVLSAMSIILATDGDHVVAALNLKDEDKRKAGANLMRSTAIRLNQLRKDVK